MFKGEVTHLQGIIFSPANPDLVLQEVRQAILFHQEAVIHQVSLVVHHLAGLHHHIAADLPVAVLIPQVLLPRALHQGAAPHPAVAVVAVAEDTSSLIQITVLKQIVVIFIQWLLYC